MDKCGTLSYSVFASELELSDTESAVALSLINGKSY